MERSTEPKRSKASIKNGVNEKKNIIFFTPLRQRRDVKCHCLNENAVIRERSDMEKSSDEKKNTVHREILCKWNGDRNDTKLLYILIYVKLHVSNF